MARRGRRGERQLELGKSALLHGCTRCAAAVLLLAPVDGHRLCARCWHHAGEPFLDCVCGAAHEVETRTRETMLKRGGADRYRVLAGKT